MIYRYSIRALGAVQEGYLSARSEPEAMDRILLYFPDAALLDLSVDIWGSLFSFPGRRDASFTTKSSAIFSERIAIYLESGLDPGSAVDLLRSQDPAFQSVSDLILMARRSGSRIVSCLGLAGFPKDFLPILSSAEEAGSLAQAFRKVARTLQTMTKLKSDVKKNLIVPMIELVLMVVFLILVFFMLLPRFAQVIAEFPGREKPEGLIALSLWLSSHPGIAFAGLGGAVGIFLVLFSIQKVRKLFLGWLTKIPVLDRMLRTYATYRFLLTFSSLVTSGLPAAEALSRMGSSAQSHADIDMLERMRRGLVKEGRKFSDVVREEDRFSQDFADWLSAVETTNAFDEEILKMEKAYGEIFEAQLQTAQSLVTPALVVLSGLGAVVMGISLYGPLFSLITKVMRKMM